MLLSSKDRYFRLWRPLNACLATDLNLFPFKPSRTKRSRPEKAPSMSSTAQEISLWFSCLETKQNIIYNYKGNNTIENVWHSSVNPKQRTLLPPLSDDLKSLYIGETIHKFNITNKFKHTKKLLIKQFETKTDISFTISKKNVQVSAKDVNRCYNTNKIDHTWLFFFQNIISWN